MDLIASATAWALLLTLLLTLAPELPRLTVFLRRERSLTLVLAAAVLTTVSLRVGLTPGYERLYTDEAYYLAAAHELARQGHAAPEGYHKAYGWPALIGAAFWLLGPSNALAVQLSTALAGLGAALTSALGWLLTRRLTVAAWAGLTVSLWPLHGLWSRTSEANVPGATLAALAALCLWLHEQEPGARRATLATAALGLACATRPEAWALAAVALLTCTRKGPVLAGMACALPNLLAYGRVHLDSNLDRALGAGLGEAALLPWTHLLGAPLHPRAFAGVLTIAGLIAIHREPRRAGLLTLWVLGVLTLLSLAGAGALTRPERFLLAATTPLALLAAIGLDQATRLRGAPSIAAGLTLATTLAVTAAPGWRASGEVQGGYLLQHGLPERLRGALDPECLLVAAHPELYRGVLTQEVVPASQLDALPADRCLDLVWDLPCFEWGHSPYAGWCAQIASFGEPVARYRLDPPHDATNREARLYHREALTP